jgi:hypothetical protein
MRCSVRAPGKNAYGVTSSNNSTGRNRQIIDFAETSVRATGDTARVEVSRSGRGGARVTIDL